MNDPEALTRAYYDWSVWAQGWLQAPEPVELAPPFAWPPWWHSATPATDDTRHEPWLRRLFQSGAGTKRSQQKLGFEGEVRSVKRASSRPELIELELLPKPNASLPSGLSIAWLASLTGLQAPLSFEICRRARQLTLRLAYEPQDHALNAAALQAVAPGVTVRSARSLASLWYEQAGDRDLPETRTLGFEYGLAREASWSLESRADNRSLPDVLVSLAAALDQLPEDSQALFQVLLTPSAAPWGQALVMSSCDRRGAPLDGSGELLKAAEHKAADALFAATLRLIMDVEPEPGYAVAHALTSSLASRYRAGGNTLVPLSDTDPEQLVLDVLARRTRRLGMVLSERELAALVTLPSEPKRVAGLVMDEPRPEPPRFQEGVELGESSVRGSRQVVRLRERDRLRHVHLVGASGSGKSNLLLAMIQQDLEAGSGLVLLDPHGDLADDVLARLPEEHSRDVVVIDPDAERVVGWNVLAASSEAERELLASDLVGVFRRLATSWGDQMTTVLSNAVLALLDVPEPHTLIELRRFLSDERYRAQITSRLSDPYLRQFWEHEWPNLIGRRPQVPILTRLDGLLRHRLVRETLTVREGGLDFRALMDSGAVIIARLSQGTLGRENAALLGALLVSRLQQAALTRADTQATERSPFYLYLDEFHEVATPSMTSLFSGIRKYGVGLTVAHQDLHQLTRSEKGLERAVMTNTHTRIVFRVDEADARVLERGFAHFDAGDLTRLETGSAIARIGSSQQDFELAVPLVEPVEADVARGRIEAVEAESQRRYGQLRPKTPKRVEGRADLAAAESAELEGVPESVAASAPPAVEPGAETERDDPKQTATTPEMPAEGRGGPEHRYLQSLIRTWAQERGYRAELEVELAAGGRVDLVIEPNERNDRIAVEVSVTTSQDDELTHARACVAAGFAHVALVSPRTKFRAALQSTLGSLSEEERRRVAVYAPEEFLAWLQALPLSTERVAGYTVTTSYQTARVSDGAAARRERLNQVIAKSLERVRKGKS